MNNSSSITQTQRPVSTAAPPPVASSTAASSYQNKDGCVDEPTSAQGYSNNQSCSRRSLTGRRRRRRSFSRPDGIFQMARQALSLDEYQQAESEESFYSDDDDEEPANGQDDDFEPIPYADDHRHELEPRHWRWIGVAVLGLFFIVSVTFTAKSGKLPNRGKGSLSSDNGICNDPIEALRPLSVVTGLENGVVAADHAVCSEMGTAVMRDNGGNAVDAAVTTALCLGVANPASSGIGGGGFMLVHADPATEGTGGAFPVFHDKRKGVSPESSSGKVTEVIDCREVAPSAASTDMFLGANIPQTAAVTGGLAIGVPGELRGLELAHARHGRLPWAQVVEPAMKLARDGVKVNANLAHEIRLNMDEIKSTDNGLLALLTKQGNWKRPLREGDTLRNPKLADTLQAVMDEGSDAIYTGIRAAALAQEAQDAGGILTTADLESYHATLRTPVAAHDIQGFSVVGVPPPSSGGAVIIGALRFLTGYTIPFASFADTLSAHRMVEACRHVFAIRMSLSDPDYMAETTADAVKDLIEGDYLEGLRQATLDNTTLPLSQYGGSKWAQLKDSDGGGDAKDAKEGDRQMRRRLYRPFGNLDDHGTSHFSIVDKDGNAVSMTTSVNVYFGSKVVSPSTGIIFNDQMDDFSNPGRTNYFGLRPSESNYIKPGKVPLSSMSPTMVFTTVSATNGLSLGELRLVVGASGGPKIISAVLQVILNYIMMGKPLFDSIVHPRLHDQLIYHGSASTTTEKSTLEQGPTIDVSDRTRNALANRGHTLLDIDYAGTVQAVAIDIETNHRTAVCDVRKGGTPAGY